MDTGSTCDAPICKFRVARPKKHCNSPATCAVCLANSDKSKGNESEGKEGTKPEEEKQPEQAK